MARLPTAAALALLLLTAGVAGVVSAEPNSTDAKPTPTGANVTDVATVADRAPDVGLLDRTTDRRHDVAPDVDDATFEGQLARRLAQFDLTDAQVREVVSEASRLRDDGASRLVIRSSIVTNLYEFGVDAPFLYANGDDANDEPPADAHRRFHQLLRSADLTSEQAREVHSMAHRMYEAGATRAEILRAVNEKLEEYGVDVDEIRDDRAHHLHRRAMQLDDRADRLHVRAHRLQVAGDDSAARAAGTYDAVGDA